MAPPISTRPRFLPSGSFHRPFIFIQQRADRMKTTIRKLTKLITWITAMSNSVKLWAMLCRACQDGWVMVDSSDKTWSTGEENGKSLQYSCLENPMNSMKRQKDMTLKDEVLRLVGAQYATYQGCILSLGLFNFCVEYIMWNVGLDEIHARIKIARRNINNLRNAGDATLIAESKEDLKSFLMKVKEESEKAGLKKNGEIIPGRMKRLSHSKNSAQLWMWLVMEVKSNAVKNNIA